MFGHFDVYCICSFLGCSLSIWFTFCRKVHGQLSRGRKKKVNNTVEEVEEEEEEAAEEEDRAKKRKPVK